jgi:aryl-alcohol dehydrogenase-like predicted oxidoreductase
MDKLNRREFVGTSLAVTGALAFGMSEAAEAEMRPRKPSDQVKLGKTNIKVSLVGMGTGSIGWNHESNQTRLGHEGFTRLVRHALDNGITLFDCADQYGSNPYLREAMRGVPRDKYVVQTKTNSRDAATAKADIDRYLVELGVDYIDSLILHCATEGDWTTRFRGVMDVMEEAKQKGKIRAHGVTCHSFEALEAAYASDWVEINQVRWNPGKSHMDNDVETCRALFAKMRKKGQGMIGMKVVGQGDLLKDNPGYRDACYRFQIESGVVDAFVVGLEKLEHVDQMIHGTQIALNEVGYRLAHQA